MLSRTDIHNGYRSTFSQQRHQLFILQPAEEKRWRKQKKMLFAHLTFNNSFHFVFLLAIFPAIAFAPCRGLPLFYQCKRSSISHTDSSALETPEVSSVRRKKHNSITMQTGDGMARTSWLQICNEYCRAHFSQLQLPSFFCSLTIRFCPCRQRMYLCVQHHRCLLTACFICLLNFNYILIPKKWKRIIEAG